MKRAAVKLGQCPNCKEEEVILRTGIGGLNVSAFDFDSKPAYTIKTTIAGGAPYMLERKLVLQLHEDTRRVKS